MITLPAVFVHLTCNWFALSPLNGLVVCVLLLCRLVLCCVVLWFGCGCAVSCRFLSCGDRSHYHALRGFVCSWDLCVCVLLALLLNNPAYHHLLLSDLTHGPNRLTNCHSQQEKPQNLSQGKREGVHFALRKGRGVVSSPGSS